MRFYRAKRLPGYLFRASSFPLVARDCGIQTPEKELVFFGALTPLQVGRESAYDMRQVKAIAARAAGGSR